eukprot:g1167.t1
MRNARLFFGSFVLLCSFWVVGYWLMFPWEQSSVEESLLVLDKEEVLLSTKKEMVNSVPSTVEDPQACGQLQAICDAFPDDGSDRWTIK